MTDLATVNEQRAIGVYHKPQPIGVYKPTWKYDLETLWKDLSAHLVFGTATAGAFGLLTSVGVKQ